MMAKGTEMYTKETKPTRIYKVVFENIVTGSVDFILVESTSAEEAGYTIIERLGNDYDLIKCISVKSKELN